MFFFLNFRPEVGLPVVHENRVGPIGLHDFVQFVLQVYSVTI